MKIPDGFVLVGAGVLVRRGYEGELAVWREQARGSGSRRGDRASGRGSLARSRLADGTQAFIRRYRHGGLLGRLLGEIYVDHPPRPWRELVATEAARRGGVAAPEVLAAIVEPFGVAVLGRPYRGLLVTRSLDGRRELGLALREARSEEERDAWVRAAALAVRRLHACGVRHPDLNVTNLLVRDSPEEPVAIIDFDRAVAGTTPVGRLGRWMARRRLSRSIAKLGIPSLTRAECRRRLAGILRGELLEGSQG